MSTTTKIYTSTHTSIKGERGRERHREGEWNRERHREGERERHSDTQRPLTKWHCATKKKEGMERICLWKKKKAEQVHMKLHACMNESHRYISHRDTLHMISNYTSLLQKSPIKETI